MPKKRVFSVYVDYSDLLKQLDLIVKDLDKAIRKVGAAKGNAAVDEVLNQVGKAMRSRAKGVKNSRKST